MPDASKRRLGEILEIESWNFNNHPPLLIDPSCDRISPHLRIFKKFVKDRPDTKNLSKIDSKFTEKTRTRAT